MDMYTHPADSLATSDPLLASSRPPEPAPTPATILGATDIAERGALKSRRLPDGEVAVFARLTTAQRLKDDFFARPATGVMVVRVSHVGHIRTIAHPPVHLHLESVRAHVDTAFWSRVPLDCCAYIRGIHRDIDTPSGRHDAFVHDARGDWTQTDSSGPWERYGRPD